MRIRKSNRMKLEVGMKIHKWTLLEETKERTKSGSILWKCQCDCGRISLVIGSDLRRDGSKSCGNCNRIYGIEGEDYLILEITDKNSVKYISLFDKEDIDIVQSHKWSVKHGYIVSSVYEKDKITKYHISLHREIMKKYHTIKEDAVIDHKNRQRNDNRKVNLNIVTRLENAQNATIRKDNTSGVKGVSWRKDIKKWGVSITFNRKRRHLGFFENKEDAIKARQEAEKKYHQYNESIKQQNTQSIND